MEGECKCIRVVLQQWRKAPPLPTIETVTPRREPKMPDYESMRCERRDAQLQRGADERAMRMRVTMKSDQSFLQDKRFLDLMLRKTGARVHYGTT